MTPRPGTLPAENSPANEYKDDFKRKKKVPPALHFSPRDMKRHRGHQATRAEHCAFGKTWARSDNTRRWAITYMMTGAPTRIPRRLRSGRL